MRIFLYEDCTGGGAIRDSISLQPSLLREGTAMVTALAEDLHDGGHEIVLLQDARHWTEPATHDCQLQPVRDASEWERHFKHLASDCDAMVLIAPEIEQTLGALSRKVAGLTSCLLSPCHEFIQLTAHKPRLADHLAEAGLPVPRHQVLVREPVSATDDRPVAVEVPGDLPFPVVVKPIDGAGSLGVRCCANLADIVTWPPNCQFLAVEEFCPGLPASVSALCGPSQTVILPPCEQHLSNDGQFRYLGGATPLPEPLQSRAARLAGQTIDALPKTRGYLGIDMVLARNAEERDVIIEVNPRLTTSYLGLRQAAQTNFAQAMIDVAMGEPVELSFSTDRIEFAPA